MDIKKRTYGAWLPAVLFVLIVGCGSGSGLEDGIYADDPEDGVGLTGIVSTADSPAGMEVGGIIAYDLDDGEVSVDFAGANPGAKYILITGTVDISTESNFIVSADFIGGGKSSFQITDDYKTVDQEPFGAQEILSAWLRAAEGEISLTESPPDESEMAPLFSKSIGLGSVQTFKVLRNIGARNRDYEIVEASARCIGQYIVLFVDTRVGEDALPYDDMLEACDIADTIAAEEFNLIGRTSDVNGDGLVSVLITPQINILGGAVDGIIAGYFYGADLYGSLDASNFQEIVYIIAPDPSGQYNLPISTDYLLEDLLPNVFAHELQHAISYNQHVFVNGGSSEESWLNEGMSHLMEDLMGYGDQNIRRYALFLDKPWLTQLVSEQSPNLRERGAIYLFLRYLYEQAADARAFLKDLLDTDQTGIRNLVAAFAGTDPNFNQFSEFLAQWTLTLAVDDREIVNSPRYNFREQTMHHKSGNWQGVVIDGRRAGDRSATLKGIRLEELSNYQIKQLRSSSASYYEIETAPSTVLLRADNDKNYAVLVRTE